MRPNDVAAAQMMKAFALLLLATSVADALVVLRPPLARQPRCAVGSAPGCAASTAAATTVTAWIKAPEPKAIRAPMVDGAMLQTWGKHSFRKTQASLYNKII